MLYVAIVQVENLEDIIKNKNVDGTASRVDHYWRDVLAIVDSDGCTLKYPNLAMVVKSLLVITHSNADVERGFSDSGQSVTAGRSALTEASINGLRSTRDGLKLFNDRPHLVPMTTSFYLLADKLTATML